MRFRGSLNSRSNADELRDASRLEIRGERLPYFAEAKQTNVLDLAHDPLHTRPGTNTSPLMSLRAVRNSAERRTSTLPVGDGDFDIDGEEAGGMLDFESLRRAGSGKFGDLSGDRTRCDASGRDADGAKHADRTRAPDEE